MTAIELYRVGRWCYERGIPIVPKLVYYLIRLIFHSVVPMSVEIGEGTSMAYCLGIVLHARCRIGKNVVIAHQVTVGGQSGRYGLPVIEDNCYIGPGAKVLGPIRIGAGSLVGANAVVINDVPPRSVVAGIPAQIIRSDINIQEDYSVEELPGFRL
jgi:serine O-acetyltransferase